MLLCRLHCPHDPERRASGDTAYEERADGAPDIRVRSPPRAGDVRLDGPKHEQDDTGDDSGVNERDVCTRDEKVGKERDQSTDKVSHPDGEGGDVESSRRDFFYT